MTMGIRPYAHCHRKSKIGCESVRFLGFCCGFNLLFGDPERVKAMALIPEPVTKKEVRRYIGGTAFYSHLPPRKDNVTDMSGLPLRMTTSTRSWWLFLGGALSFVPRGASWAALSGPPYVALYR